MPLSDTSIRNAKASDKPFKMADEKGLYLLVNKAGKYWRFDYRFGGKRKTLAMGVYPDVGLKEARNKRDSARKSLAEDPPVDPGAKKQEAKRAAKASTENSFEAVAREWHKKFSHTWTPAHVERLLKRFEKDVFPCIGSKPIGQVTAPDILAMLRKIESRGALDTAHRTHQNCGQVFRYAIATGRVLRDPSGDLKGALPPVQEKHHASITDPKAVGELLRAIEGYTGSFITKCALKIAPLVFVRPGELRSAEWSEIDFDKAEWRIPAEKMKMRMVHVVPLSTQVLELFRQVHELTGSGRYVFPGERTRERPMSENTVNAALRRLGYSKDEMTGHGFRSMASTILNEQGWHRDAIERQLAHAERDGVRAAYNYAEHLPERREMMQEWSDYLDSLRDGARVITIKTGAYI